MISLISCVVFCQLVAPCFVSAKSVRETLVLTWEFGSPNGQVRQMIHMNGLFPGPNFVWDEDDDIEVTGAYPASCIVVG